MTTIAPRMIGLKAPTGRAAAKDREISGRSIFPVGAKFQKLTEAEKAAISLIPPATVPEAPTLLGLFRSAPASRGGPTPKKPRTWPIPSAATPDAPTLLGLFRSARASRGGPTPRRRHTSPSADAAPARSLPSRTNGLEIPSRRQLTLSIVSVIHRGLDRPSLRPISRHWNVLAERASVRRADRRFEASLRAAPSNIQQELLIMRDHHHGGR